jgi:glycine cleavage system H protein
MDVQGYHIPDDLMFTKEHEWAKNLGGVVRVGITDYAAKTLNDVVYVTSPQVNSKVEQMKSMGTVESIKAVSEIY